jgi:hypothetical protein
VPVASHKVGNGLPVSGHVGPRTDNVPDAGRRIHREWASTMDDNDVIDRLVATADPLTVAPGELPFVAEALDRMAAGISATPMTSAGRRRRWIAGVAAASAVVVVGLPAAADWVSARTGWFGQEGMTENDASEFLRLDSPEISQIVAAHVRQLDLALPDGVTPRDVVDGVIARLSTDDDPAPALMQETGVRATVGWEIACRWGGIWLDASGVDPGTAAVAHRHLTDAATRTGALDAALGDDDAQLARAIRANCAMPAAD